MRVILFELGIEKAKVLAWSSVLQRKVTNTNIDPEGNDTLINRQHCVISELVRMNQALAKRVTELEKQQAQRDEDISVSMTRVEPGTAGKQEILQATPWRQQNPRAPAVIWFERYTKTPRFGDVRENRQKKSTYKKIVNYTKLVLPNAFKLDPSSPTYCDHVLDVGQQSEENMFKFFVAHMDHPS
ncbi:hypothetical protein PHMEG_00015547 [Phytophthora megakarya]|uniref:Uncharacterized protein n=1 Tax=Phytophthora megakarya TaxID=4795 RepID=A0A225W157_9STRA|nr:hypothetical protein PHMEG_00015547 [Phytophthora megakarya]